VVGLLGGARPPLGRVRQRKGQGFRLPGVRGLQTSVTNSVARYPELAAQFDVEANGERTPDQVVAGNAEKLRWACPVAADHRRQSTGKNRLKGNGRRASSVRRRMSRASCRSKPWPKKPGRR
jgi:hypothetical protein